MKFRGQIADDADEFLDEIPKSSAHEILDDVRFLWDFLSHLLKRQVDLPPKVHLRLLVVTILYDVRLQRMKTELDEAVDEDICNNGFSILGNESTYTKVKMILKIIVSLWKTPPELHQAVFSWERSISVVANVIKDAESLSPSDLRKELLAL
jgi:hypothetical protein